MARRGALCCRQCAAQGLVAGRDGILSVLVPELIFPVGPMPLAAARGLGTPQPLAAAALERLHALREQNV